MLEVRCWKIAADLSPKWSKKKNDYIAPAAAGRRKACPKRKGFLWMAHIGRAALPHANNPRSENERGAPEKRQIVTLRGCGKDHRMRACATVTWEGSWIRMPGSD
jgi:hypothetical protein